MVLMGFEAFLEGVSLTTYVPYDPLVHCNHCVVTPWSKDSVYFMYITTKFNIGQISHLTCHQILVVWKFVIQTVEINISLCSRWQLTPYFNGFHFQFSRLRVWWQLLGLAWFPVLDLTRNQGKRNILKLKRGGMNTTNQLHTLKKYCTVIFKLISWAVDRLTSSEDILLNDSMINWPRCQSQPPPLPQIPSSLPA